MTTTTTPGLAALRLRYLTVQARIKADEEELDQIKAALRDAAHDEPGQYAAGDGQVTISASRRFNEAKALPLIDEAVLPFVTRTETRVDKDKLKALAPEVFEQAHDVYAHRIGVR